jgi:hypothetical protein
MPLPTSGLSSLLGVPFKLRGPMLYTKVLAGQQFFQGGSTDSVENRGQTERGYGGGSPLVRGSTQFANE